MDGNWKVLRFGEGDDFNEPVPGSFLTLDLVDDHLSGHAGVNRYTGWWLGDGFGPIATTMMTGSPEFMEQESRFLELLNRCDEIRFGADGRMELLIEGVAVMALEARSTRLTGEIWQLIGYNNGRGGFQSSTITPLVTVEFNEEGQASGSGGCNRYRATYECGDESMSFGPATSTRMACPDPELMEQEDRYMALLQTVRTYRFADLRGRGRLDLYDGDGNRVLSFVVVEDDGTRGEEPTV